MCSVAVQTTMAAPVLCQQSDDRCDKDITVKTPTGHEYSESPSNLLRLHNSFCGQPDLIKTLSLPNHSAAQQLGTVQVAAKVPYKEGGQLSSVKDSQVQLVDNGDKRSAEQMFPPQIVSKDSAESQTLQGGLVDLGIVQTSHDVVVGTACSTSGITRELILKGSETNQELAGQQSGNVASTNTNQVIPIKLVPVNRQGLMLEQGKQIMVKSLEVPTDNVTTKLASISTASVGIPTAIGHLLQGHTSNISMDQREVSGDNQAAVCAARADINTKSVSQSVFQEPSRDSRVQPCIEIQPSHPKIPRITGPCSVDDNSKDVVSFPIHSEDGKSGKCNQSDTSHIPTPSATEKVVLVKLTPHGGKGQGNGTTSSINCLGVLTKKSGLNSEQANVSEGKGTDCNETVSILRSLLTQSTGGRGTKRSSSLALNEIAERTESTKRCFVTQQTTNTAMSKDASSNYITDVAKAIDSNIQSTVCSTKTDKSMVLLNVNHSGNSSNAQKINQLIPVQIFPEGPGGSKRGCHIKYIGITADEDKLSNDSSRHKNVTSENDSICNQKSNSSMTQKKHRVPNILKRRNVSANVHFSVEKSDLAKVKGKFVAKLNSNKQAVPETVTVEPEPKLMAGKQKIQNCESKSRSGGLEISDLDGSSYPDTVSSDEEVAGTEEISNQEIPTVRFHLETEASTTGSGQRWTAVRESNDKSEMPKRSETVLTSTESSITGHPEAPEISAEENETSPENHSCDGELSEHLNDGKPNIASNKPWNIAKSPQKTPIVSTSSKRDSTDDTGNSDDCSENVLKEPSSEHMTETESGDLVQPTIPTVRFQLTTKPGTETPSLNWTKVTGDTISSNPRSGPAEDKVLPDQPTTVTTGVTDTAGEPTRFCESRTENGTIRDAKNPNADKTLSCETIYENGDGSVNKLSLPDYFHDKNKLSVETHEDVNEGDTRPVQHASSTHFVQEVGNSLTASNTTADRPLKLVVSPKRGPPDTEDKPGGEGSILHDNQTTSAGIPPRQSKAAPIIYQTSSAQLIKLTGPLSFSTDGSVMVSNSGHIPEGTHPPPESSTLLHTRNPEVRTRVEDIKVIPPIFAPCSFPVQGKTVSIKIVSSGDTSAKSTPSTKALSQDCISQQNVSSQTVIWINQPSKSLWKQNSRKSDVLATADTPSSQGQSKRCPDIETVKNAPPSDKTQLQPQKSNMSTGGKSMAEMLKGMVDVPSKEPPKQGTTTKIIPLHNILRSTTGPNQNLPVKQKVNYPPGEIKKCSVVLKSEPALQLNQFLEKQSCYVPKVQSGSPFGELAVQDHRVRVREIKRRQTCLYPNKRNLNITLKSSTGEATESISSQTQAGMSYLSWKDSDPVLNEVETLKAQKNVDAIEVTPDGQKLILKKDLLCIICRQQFEKPEGLAAHVMVSHFKFKCQVCLTIFTKQDLYVQHMKGPGCLQENARLFRPSFRCGDCWKCYRTRAALDKHQLRQHGVANRCSICEKTFPTFGPLRHHLFKDHVEKTWVCDLCGKFFQLENYMLKHRKRHSMEKTFLCPTCGKCFMDSSTLRDHVDIHKPEGERQYRFMCSYCGNRFNRRNIFQDHVNTHTGKTPYACKSCDVTFSRLANLKKHEIVRHSDKKPFVCEICSKAFKLKKSLKAHMVTHTGVSKYKCTYCQRSFGNNGGLKAHVERCRKKHLTQVNEAQGESVTEEASIVVEQLNEFGENSNLCEVISASRIDEAEVDTDINRTLSEPFVYMCTACNHEFDDMISADMHIKLCNGTGLT